MDILALHKHLYGTQPLAEQLRYYASGKCGWLCAQPNKLHLATVFLHAIYRTQPLYADYQRVHFFVAPAFHQWTDNRLREIAMMVANRLPEKYINSFKTSMRFISRFPVKKRDISVIEPPYWTAFGFNEQAPKPKWMSDKLLELDNLS